MAAIHKESASRYIDRAALSGAEGCAQNEAALHELEPVRRNGDRPGIAGGVRLSAARNSAAEEAASFLVASRSQDDVGRHLDRPTIPGAEGAAEYLPAV